MKVNIMGLLRGAAMELKSSDRLRAYMLLEFGNDLRLVMRGEATLAEWQAVYVGADGEPFDIDRLLPTPAEQEAEEGDAHGQTLDSRHLLHGHRGL